MKWTMHILRALAGFVVASALAAAFAFAWMLGEVHR